MIFTLKGCCCFPLKKGCIIIGCFSAVKAFLMFLLSSFFAYMGHNNARKAETEESRRLSIGVEVTSIIMAIFSGIEIVANIFLLKGTIDNKPKLIFPWLVLCLVDLTISWFLIISAIVLVALYEPNTEFIWTLSVEPFNIGLNIYFHLVVHSYHKQLNAVTPEVTTSRPSSDVSKNIDSVQPLTPLTEYLLHVPQLKPLQYTLDKKLPKLGGLPGTEHFGSVVSCNQEHI